MSLNQTPRSNRVHIGIFGRRNAGKSSLVNAISGQEAAIVSPEAGTTTDPVYRSMEIHGVGPVVLIDTAGIDDEGALGKMRVEKSLQVLRKTDLALLVVDPSCGIGEPEEKLLGTLKEKSIPVICVLNKKDLGIPAEGLPSFPQGVDVFQVSALTGEGIPRLIKGMADKIDAARLSEEPTIVGDLIKPGDLVVLTIPVDIEAPKGRLILPQVQTLRDILDHQGIGICVKLEQLPDVLQSLAREPALVITDSQIFREVDAIVPPSVPLTSFSILFARYKGDFSDLVDGTRCLSSLSAGDRVLIAEACTHHPVEDDIGRVKIPAWLEKRAGGKLDFTWTRGLSYPEDLSSYKVVIHCGGCMLNRKEMLERIKLARRAGVPITNYGMTIAWANGILERALKPFMQT